MQVFCTIYFLEQKPTKQSKNKLHPTFLNLYCNSDEILLKNIYADFGEQQRTVFKRFANQAWVRPWMRRRKKKQRFGVECVGSGGVPWRRLFSLHTPGTERASASRQSDVSSLRGVYFCCVVCGGQNISFIQNIVRSELWSADRSHVGILACQGLSLHAFRSAKDTEMSQTAYST